jgi:hypothetical protein
LLVAPFITRDVAERCRQLHLPFIETAGNAYLEGPGLFIYAVGQPRPAERREETRGYVRFRKGLDRRLVDPQRMIEEWVTHYPVTLRPKLNARRFQADPERLHQTDLAQQNAFWGGEPAADS